MSSSIGSATRAAFVTYPLSHDHTLEKRMGIVALMLMLLFALTSPLLAHDFKAGDIDIAHPWSRATPQGAKVAAGYLTLKNSGSLPDRLVAVSAEIAGKAEIHEMAVDDKGVMTMRPLAGGVEIPAGGEVELKPGGLHLMFMSITRGAKEGEKLKGTLTFEKAGTIEVEFDVQAMGGSAGAQSGHSAHGG